MKQMKQRALFMAGLLAAALVFGTIFVGCGDGGDGGDGFSGHTLTVTGIPAAYNGKYIAAFYFDNSNTIIGAASINGDNSANLVKIAGGSAVIPIYHFDAADSSFKPYTGTDSETFTLNIYASSSVLITDTPAASNDVSVDFATGSPSVTW
ncbi:MAG: hypothetical protein LBD24_08195 [Spirochaetaceae bacterium]|jgi:hypothetical protein|nr:hypothetical protein [Spirochaetaceae bacterium]